MRSSCVSVPAVGVVGDVDAAGVELVPRLLLPQVGEAHLLRRRRRRQRPRGLRGIRGFRTANFRSSRCPESAGTLPGGRGVAQGRRRWNKKNEHFLPFGGISSVRRYESNLDDLQQPKRAQAGPAHESRADEALKAALQAGP